MAKRDEGVDVLQDDLKGHANGYRQGLNDFKDLVETHGFEYFADIYEHCFNHAEELRDWQSHDDNQPPPPIPRYIPNQK